MKSKTRAKLLQLLAQHPQSSSAFLLEKLGNKSKYISRQALHKLLSQLRQEGIVVRSGMRYSLSPVWLSETQEFLNLAHERLLTTTVENALRLPVSTRYSKTFRRFDDADNYWCMLLLALLRSGEEKRIFQWHPSLWFLFLEQGREDAFQRTIGRQKVELYEIVSSPRTSFEEQLYAEWKAQHLTKSTAEGPFQMAQSYHLTVIGDYVVKVVLNRKTLSLLAKLFRALSNKPRDGVYQAIRLVSLPVSVRVEVMRSPKRAGKMKKQFEEFFGI